MHRGDLDHTVVRAAGAALVGTHILASTECSLMHRASVCTCQTGLCWSTGFSSDSRQYKHWIMHRCDLDLTVMCAAGAGAALVESHPHACRGMQLHKNPCKCTATPTPADPTDSPLIAGSTSTGSCTEATWISRPCVLLALPWWGRTTSATSAEPM